MSLAPKADGVFGRGRSTTCRWCGTTTSSWSRPHWSLRAPGDDDAV